MLLDSLRKLNSTDYLNELMSYLEKNSWNTLRNIENFDAWYSSKEPLSKFSDDEGLLSRLD